MALKKENGASITSEKISAVGVPESGRY